MMGLIVATAANNGTALIRRLVGNHRQVRRQVRRQARRRARFVLRRKSIEAVFSMSQCIFLVDLDGLVSLYACEHTLNFSRRAAMATAVVCCRTTAENVLSRGWLSSGKETIFSINVVYFRSFL